MRRMRILAALCWTILVATTVQAERPNVLFIAVDDLRVELGCYGSKHVKSPNIDRLASKGTLFERAYCQQTVCNASRASLLTGMRPDTLRVWDLPTHFRQNRPDVVTLPQLFKNNGYDAQCIGKIFHNWRQDDWKGDPQSWSVPSVLHYNSHGNDKPKVEGELPPNLASGKGGIECRDVPDNAYFDGRVAKAAIDTLDRISRNDNPFFLAVGFWKPHTPFNAPKKYWDLYDRKAIPVPQHVTPPTDVPEIALTSSRYRDGADSDELREMHHGHLAAISYLDAQVGKVLSKLDQLELRENTIVVLWSDHGLHLGEHGLTRKTTAFELDAHVPLVISSAKHKPGGRTEALVELLDLYPTLASLAGVDRADIQTDGIDLGPHLFAGKPLPDRMLFWRARSQSAVRSGPWKLYRNGKQTELYNLDDDVGEQHNLADRQPDRVKQLREAWRRWEADVNNSAVKNTRRKPLNEITH